MKRWLFILLALVLTIVPAKADTLRWVDFNIGVEALSYAMEQDIATSEQEFHISWIDILAVAACRTGGKCSLSSVKKAASDLKSRMEQAAEELRFEEAASLRDFWRMMEEVMGVVKAV